MRASAISNVASAASAYAPACSQCQASVSRQSLGRLLAFAIAPVQLFGHAAVKGDLSSVVTIGSILERYMRFIGTSIIPACRYDSC